MEHRPLGRTGMQVSPLCLGAMMFGRIGEPDHAECVRIIHAALDAGINFIDTADIYSRGESEQIVGEALAGGRRDGVVLATKFHGAMGDDPNERGNSRRWIVREVENSLRRLGTDRIDLYQVHRLDEWTDLEETLSALTDLRSQGKINAFGCSTFAAEWIVESHWVSEHRRLGRFATEQPPYSILARGVERDVLPTAERHGMGVIPWSPLAGGWLTGRYRHGREIEPTRRAEVVPAVYDLDRPENQAKLDAADALARLADEAGISLIHMALGFTLAHPAITAPIIGPRTMAQLESQIGAADVALDDELLDRIDAIVPPGTTISETDRGLVPDALSDPRLRRRRR